MSRRTKTLLTGLGLLVAGVLGSAQLGALRGNRPTDLGVRDGKLRACPDSPNCVSSQAPTDDRRHYVPAIDRLVDPAAAVRSLRSIISTMPRTTVVEETDDYLYVEFESALFRFVDDVELYLPAEEPVIHVRSASRLGTSDFGANRRRIEEIGRRYRTAVTE